MKEILSRVAHFCLVCSVGFCLVYFYGLLTGLDEKTIRLSGLLVVLIAWALEQRAANKS